MNRLCLALALLCALPGAVLGVAIFNVGCGIVGIVRMVNAEVALQHRFCGGHLCDQARQANPYRGLLGG